MSSHVVAMRSVEKRHNGGALGLAGFLRRVFVAHPHWLGRTRRMWTLIRFAPVMSCADGRDDQIPAHKRERGSVAGLHGLAFISNRRRRETGGRANSVFGCLASVESERFVRRAADSTQARNDAATGDATIQIDRRAWRKGDQQTALRTSLAAQFTADVMSS